MESGNIRRQQRMDEDIKHEFEKVWEEIKEIKEEINGREEFPKKEYAFLDKNKDHPILLEELLKADYCHLKNGLIQEEILKIFRYNGRPVVPKKIRDLLHIWKKRKRIDAIKVKGEKQLRYFWVENERKD